MTILYNKKLSKLVIFIFPFLVILVLTFIMIKEIQEIIGEITSISPEIEVRADRIMVMFEYIIPDEETTKKIETALSQLGKVRPLHCREYDIICWSLYR